MIQPVMVHHIPLEVSHEYSYSENTARYMLGCRRLASKDFPSLPEIQLEICFLQLSGISTSVLGVKDS